jgi:hypothetical protein
MSGGDLMETLNTCLYYRQEDRSLQAQIKIYRTLNPNLFPEDFDTVPQAWITDLYAPEIVKYGPFQTEWKTFVGTLSRVIEASDAGEESAYLGLKIIAGIGRKSLQHPQLLTDAKFKFELDQLMHAYYDIDVVKETVYDLMDQSKLIESFPGVHYIWLKGNLIAIGHSILLQDFTNVVVNPASNYPITSWVHNGTENIAVPLASKHLKVIAKLITPFL